LGRGRPREHLDQKEQPSRTNHGTLSDKKTGRGRSKVVAPTHSDFPVHPLDVTTVAKVPRPTSARLVESRRGEAELGAPAPERTGSIKLPGNSTFLATRHVYSRRDAGKPGLGTGHLRPGTSEPVDRGKRVSTR
jgi:hypothetical protein